MWTVLRSAALILTVGFAMPATADEAVSFPSADGTTVRGVMFRPSGSGPFPAVVALHGCGGLGGTRGPLSARHRDWAERLSAAGFVVLLPDSFGSRGLGSQCTVRERAVTPGRERTADAVGARRYLQTRPDVDARRVSLLGWSNGAMTVLNALGPAGAPRAGERDFARAVAFYPGCRAAVSRGLTPRRPLLILSGEADDWTPIGPCRDYVAAAKARGATVDLVAYPGAVHSFDDRTSRPRQRTGLAFTADGSGTARVGFDPAAYADAVQRVPAFLR